MKRWLVMGLAFMLLAVPSLGSANPNGVGDGTFDTQCGGACHGDADMNQTSSTTVTVQGDDVVYEGLLTSITVNLEGIETTTSGLLGVFLLSDLSGTRDTPGDAGWNIISNSEGGNENYVEIKVSPSQDSRNVTWTMRAPAVGTYQLYAAIHHGTEDGSEAPFFGQSEAPLIIEIVEVPENLPRLTSDFDPITQREVGEVTTMMIETTFVSAVSVEWRVAGSDVQTADITALENNRWSFEVPASIQPSLIEWRVHLEGEGPPQTTPWFQLRSEEVAWTIDENVAYLQSLALILVMMAGFVALQYRNDSSISPSNKELADLEGGVE
ncbi:MAG: hypothetical protein L7S56_08180 [Candidatus Poseidonia sp.]|nr:hypothetical protein [Poseidonia sp.]